jgi:hypothetical protein
MRIGTVILKIDYRSANKYAGANDVVNRGMGMRKNRIKTNESERPHVRLYEGAEDFQIVSSATEFRTCSERSAVFIRFFLALQRHFSLLLSFAAAWAKERRVPNSYDGFLYDHHVKRKILTETNLSMVVLRGES